MLIVIILITFSCDNANITNINVSNQAFLIYNANIVNVNNGSILENKAILIDSATIKYIDDYASLKGLVSKESQFNANNKFVIPGLWDMHVHLEGENLIEDNNALLPLYIAYGITTVRDCASDLGEQVLAWRDDINHGDLFGPQIYTAGRKLEGINSIWKGDLEIANTIELNQMLDKLEDYKVDFIKITENTLPGHLFLKSVEASKKRGFKTSGHVPIDLTINELATAGFSSIEHASYLLRLGSDENETIKQIQLQKLSKSEANKNYMLNFNQEKAIKAYHDLARTNIAVTPTLIGGKQLAYLDENDHQDDIFLQYLTKRFTDNYQWRIGRMANDSPEQKQQRKDRYQRIAKQLPYIQEAGILILAGSDSAALNTFVYPALALHEELGLFQDAGLTPLQILQSATINGAKFMNTLHTTASIDLGKEADLVILNSNPLVDIKATQDIHAVINNGNYLNRVALDSILDQVIKKRISLDNSRN